MSDKRFELAYEAGVAALRQQDATLGNLRNRAAQVLTAAALVTSFAGGLGLVNGDQTKGLVFPRSAALVLLGLLISIGWLVVTVQWPLHEWSFGPDPRLILKRVDLGHDEDKLRRELTEEFADAITENDKRIRRLGTYYRISASLLVVEVIVFAIALSPMWEGVGSWYGKVPTYCRCPSGPYSTPGLMSLYGVGPMSYTSSEAVPPGMRSMTGYEPKRRA